MGKKDREKDHVENKYESLTKDVKQKQKYRKNITDEQKKNIKIIKNNIEKIRPMNKSKK